MPVLEVSVIFPSRGRPDALQESVASLKDNAVFPEQVEILVAVDPDEEVTDELPAEIYTLPERLGYNALHEYYNYLAVRARGKWLFIWNDDVLMLTPGWDEIIRKQPEALLWPYCSEDRGGNVFPVLPKSWADCTGHVGLVPYVDLWTQAVAEMLPRRLRHIPVHVRHQKHEDRTMAEGNGQGFPFRFNQYHTPEMTREREIDAQLIRKHIRNEPGNLQLISVLVPALPSLPAVLTDLISKAAVPDEIEFLVAAGSSHSQVRKDLEGAGVMGQTQVHQDHHIGDLRTYTHGTWTVDWGEFEAKSAWDQYVRESLT